MKKIASSGILGPILWAVLDILGGLPIGPQSTDLKNLQIGPLWADWQTPYFSKRPTKWGPKYMSWQFFHKMDPL